MALIDAVGEATREESAAVARRFGLIGELDARRAREWEERYLWCTDPFEAVAAEVSAAQNISRARATGQVRYARVLRDELPEVAAVFATGVIDVWMVSAIIAHRKRRGPGQAPARCGAGPPLREVDEAVGAQAA